MARWATLYSMMYSLCGVPSLNIFNCGELIDNWVTIPRKKRADYYIYTELMKNMDEQLLHYPVNPGDRFEWMKKNDVLFLSATYLKYFWGLLKGRRLPE